MQTLVRATNQLTSRSTEKRFGQFPLWETVKQPNRARATLSRLSNRFLVVHVAYAALVVFLAGAITLLEVARYVPDKPLYEQGMILLPYFAGLGWGVGSRGEIVNTFPYFAIGVIDIVSAAVLAAGAYFHRTRIPPSLEDTSEPAVRYHATWDNPKKLGKILGTHLIFWGIGALLFAAKAMFLGGIYDANLHDVRTVTDPTLAFGTILSYSDRLFYVDNLEDLVGGHLYIGAILIAGGIWHILVEPWQWVKERFIFNGDGILSYSLFGVALGGFAASYFAGFNTLAHPVEFYGPTLELKSSLLPHYLNPIEGAATSRTLLANGFFWAAFFCFVGSIWELARASGFDFGEVRKTWKQAAAEVSPFPVLHYQKPIHAEPHSDWGTWYESARVESKPPFHDRPSTDRLIAEHAYSASRTEKLPAITYGKGTQSTLYEVTYHPKRSVVYHNPSTAKNSIDNHSPAATKNRTGDRLPLSFKYEAPRANHKNGIHPKSSPSTFYGSHSNERNSNCGLNQSSQVEAAVNANADRSADASVNAPVEATANAEGDRQ